MEINALPTGGHVFHRSRSFSNSSETSFEPMKTAPPIGSHVFQRIGTTFELNQDIIKTNILTNFELRRDFIGTKLLTKFHEDGTRNVASRVFTSKFTKAHLINQAQNIIGTNLLTKFYEDRKINVASRVLTRKNATPPGSHFHEDRTVNVASRVLTRFYKCHIRKKAPPLGSHVFQANIIIFEPIQDIIETNLLTKFQEDLTINVAFRPYREKCPAPGGHVFKATKSIFELIQDIIGTNLLTKFHDDQKINVTSRVLNLQIIGKMPCPRGGHVFQPTSIIFELLQDIIGMNLLAEFHEDRTINVASRVLTRFYYSHIRKNALPLGSHVFQANTNLLTIFHEDWTINVASRVLTIKNASPSGGHVFQPKDIIF
ncbi:hypothetical protein DPMN_087940 [Dreissena polymorpha]|uniref:Uncharacterized protein n=1 Tax=Dreissena polymorpha TaxID=45954 RepID=A0A9D4KU51_DREPO|nr:hypothetical protein DPMN_087940 [Dreissena polymorpha]